MGKIYQRLTVFNLCLYFDQSRCVSSFSMGDLRNVLNSLKSSTIDSVPQNVEENRYDDKKIMSNSKLGR